MSGPPPLLTQRFVAAVELAGAVHGSQRRIGTEIPYLAHLLVVTGLVLEDGGDEQEAIAAMLHDAVEDGGGRAMLAQIRQRFGERVAGIVEACSDWIDEEPKPSWLERKRSYLAHLPLAGDDGILRVALADKVHNARSIVRDYRDHGELLWERFAPRTAEDQLWYYSELADFFAASRPGGVDRGSQAGGAGAGGDGGAAWWWWVSSCGQLRDWHRSRLGAGGGPVGIRSHQCQSSTRSSIVRRS
jgi:hypothetical protein